ncbi:hypothetical protein [Parvularcula maris]|uniref:SRPBCC domain-containing protein n=1 Tax=Parvularcula maris TaxID=2965077 RepID=A0A9X2LA56_9PROT|nr:hypothetical protein [Parvularcula maris]MCQ8185930.1 hypothetical protein [Parvularcula maris]
MRNLLPILAAVTASTASAEVVSSSETGFTLSHEAVSPLAPSELWQRLMQPAEWWDPDHTYSGDAGNLSMGEEAGAYWREDWDGGSVIHGQVLLSKKGEELVLSAPFGPLISTAADCRWTIRLSPAEGGGTTITSSHVVAGSKGTGLKDLAGPVDYVMGAGVRRLAADGQLTTKVRKN